jgi:prevent-host-death family protein
MKAMTVVQAKSHFSALLAEVEAGAEIAVTRHGKVVARVVPDGPQTAASAFSDFWREQDIDLQAPPDSLAEDVAALDE